MPFSSNLPPDIKTEYTETLIYSIGIGIGIGILLLILTIAIGIAIEI